MLHQVRLDLLESDIQLATPLIGDEANSHACSLWAYPGPAVTHCDRLATAEQLERLARRILAYFEIHRPVSSAKPLGMGLTDRIQLAERLSQAFDRYEQELNVTHPLRVTLLRQAAGAYARHVLPALHQAASGMADRRSSRPEVSP